MIDMDSRDIPELYIKKAIEEFKNRKGKYILELGCMRSDAFHPPFECHDNCKSRCDGHSTMLFDSVINSEFISVDISKNSCSCALRHIKYHNPDCVKNMDAIEYLKSRNEPIDLLYLDAWDTDLKDSAEKHLEAYKIAKKNLHEKSIVLIDDTDVIWRDNEFHFAESGLSGKGRLVIPEMQNDGWKIDFGGRQTMLTRR